VEPRIQYARTSDGSNIAYHVMGDGPTLIYLVPVSHLEKEWRYPEQRAWLQRLAERCRLIRFDFRGSGLSDRDRELEFDRLPLDIEAIVRKERLNRFAIIGGLSSAAVAAQYAHSFPEKVSRLILWCPYGPGSSDSSPPLQAVRASGTKDKRTYMQVLAELLSGWDDMDQARRYAAYNYDCIDPSHFDRFLERFKNLDLARTFGRLTIPVLVLQREEAVFPTVETARNVAAMIGGARLGLLEGSAILPFLGDTDAALSAIDEFLSEPNEHRPGGLTEREFEILTLLSQGCSNGQIANALSISARTVDRHIANLYRRIGAHNRAEATAYAYRHGIAVGD
jgi:pimeloyl-ACP methyl ester carboxylesterase/DNA-binding CsgD family transcriptional regulator